MNPKIILTLIFIAFVNITIVFADEIAGKIVRFEGIVKIYEKGGIKGKKVKTQGVEIYVKDKIKTYKKSKALIILSDKSEVILKEQSTMEIKGTKEINTESGKVLFHIKKKKEIKGILITSKTVVIGVKGTKFIVDNEDDNMQVFLKEGSLNVKSLKGEFTKYGKKETEEFNEFRNEFDEYKETILEEFKEFVKEFEMGAGTAISITGNEVRDIKISDNVLQDFKLFEAFGSIDTETDDPDNKILPDTTGKTTYSSPKTIKEQKSETIEKEKRDKKDDFFETEEKSTEEDPFFKEEEDSEFNF